MGCGYLFAGFVAVAGLALATAAGLLLRQLGGRADTAVWVCGGLGTALLLAAGAYLPWARRAVAEAEAEVRLRETFAAEPWRWRKEWRGPWIASEDGSQLAAMWVFAVAWNGMSTPLVWAMFFDPSFRGAAWIGAVFPAVGLWLGVQAIRLTLRRRKYGRARFVPASLPGVIGGFLGGVIEVPARLDAAGDLRLVLRCVRRVTTGSGKNRRKSEKVLWEAVEHIPPERIVAGPGRTELPVLLAIPGDAEASDWEDTDRQTIWRLVAEAETPGVDFATGFVVPVFATAETAARRAAGAEASASVGSVAGERALLPEYRAGGRSAAEWDAVGVVPQVDGWRFHGGAVGGTKWVATLFAASIAGGLGWHSARGGVSPFFWWVGGFVGLLTFLIALNLWRARSELRVVGDRVRVRRQTLTGWTEREVPCAEVADVVVAQGMTAGDTTYFRLQLSPRLEAAATESERRRAQVRFADHVRGRAEAERLREEVLARLRS